MQKSPAAQQALRRGRTILSLGVVAALFTLVGVIIASRFDITPQSVAQNDPSPYPVVRSATNSDEYESPFVAVVERSQSAVVNVSAVSADNSPWWARRGNSTSSGSGFFFREDGYVLTNNHVIKDADRLRVTTASGYQYDARVVGADPATDIAVLKVDPEEKVTVIPFGDSEKIKVGDWAIAIGNPFPQQGLDRTVTVGVISAKGRSNLNFGQETPNLQDFIQTDASINPGNSGGPLLNLRGECVGINSAIASPTGSSVGIGFAIPVNLARSIVPDLIETGRVRRALLGVIFRDVTENEARRHGLSSVKGMYVDSVFNNSPAHQAGLEKGDIILEFNGSEIETSGQFSVLVQTVKDGERVPIVYSRDGDRKSTAATLVDRDSWLSRPVAQSRSEEGMRSIRWLGMELVTLSPAAARTFGVKHVPGLYVRQVFPGTPADNASVTPGTIVLQANNQPTDALADLEPIIQSLPEDVDRIPLMVQEPDGTVARKVIRP